VHTQWWKYASIGEEKGNIINNKIVPYFQNRFALDKGMSGELISTLAHPENLSLFNQERKAFFEMCLKTLQNKEIDITHYLENFFWKESNFYKQKVLTKEILYLQIKNTIDTLGHDGITHELEIIKNSQETRVQDEARYRTTYQFSKEDEQMMYFAKRIIEWIDIRKRGMMKSVYYMASFIQIIAARIGLNYEEASLLTVDELYAILGGTQVPGSTTFNERQGGCMVFFDNYEKKYIYGREGEELYRIAMNKNSDTILKGMVASRGNSQTVEAEVSVVMDTAESAFITGTILVTTMTRIEFVPLMKKARAIITDEGGLACHAAIVSRELGIPCIIGTKQATHKLKNGDKVSMNMQTGQITLLG
jgi:phosphohistidine swiveling domain-containing protein